MPPADHGSASLVVWRLGDALLAVPLDAVEEVVSVGRGGHARGRAGVLDIIEPAGLPPSPGPRHAVIVRAGPGHRRVALAADEVEGVREPGTALEVAAPPWLAGVASVHMRNLVRLGDDRVAALLDVAVLGEP